MATGSKTIQKALNRMQMSHLSAQNTGHNEYLHRMARLRQQRSKWWFDRQPLL